MKLQLYNDFDQVLATQELVRDNENLRARVLHLEKEVSVKEYERNRLE